MEFTKNNYLQGHGHGNDWYVDLSPASRKVKSYYEETVHAMENLYETKTGKFQVLYSGGVDSQYICEVFLKLKMDFDTIIIRLMSNNGEVYNQHDIAYAYEFCAKNNITPIVYDVNFDDFVESGKIVEIAESVNCCSFAVPTTFYVANKLDGYSIIAGGDPYIKYNESKNVWLFEELEYAQSTIHLVKEQWNDIKNYETNLINHKISINTIYHKHFVLVLFCLISCSIQCFQVQA